MSDNEKRDVNPDGAIRLYKPMLDAAMTAFDAKGGLLVLLNGTQGTAVVFNGGLEESFSVASILDSLPNKLRLASLENAREVAESKGVPFPEHLAEIEKVIKEEESLADLQRAMAAQGEEGRDVH